MDSITFLNAMNCEYKPVNIQLAGVSRKGFELIE